MCCSEQKKNNYLKNELTEKDFKQIEMELELNFPYIETFYLRKNPERFLDSLIFKHLYIEEETYIHSSILKRFFSNEKILDYFSKNQNFALLSFPSNFNWGMYNLPLTNYSEISSGSLTISEYKNVHLKDVSETAFCNFIIKMLVYLRDNIFFKYIKTISMSLIDHEDAIDKARNDLRESLRKYTKFADGDLTLKKFRIMLDNIFGEKLFMTLRFEEYITHYGSNTSNFIIVLDIDKVNKNFSYCLDNKSIIKKEYYKNERIMKEEFIRYPKFILYFLSKYFHDVSDTPLDEYGKMKIKKADKEMISTDFLSIKEAAGDFEIVKGEEF